RRAAALRCVGLFDIVRLERKRFSDEPRSRHALGRLILRSGRSPRLEGWGGACPHASRRRASQPSCAARLLSMRTREARRCTPLPLIPAKAGIQGQALGPRNGVPATRASRGAPRGVERMVQATATVYARAVRRGRALSASNAQPL